MTVYLYTIFLSSQCKMLMTILSDWHAITSDGHQGKNHRRKHDLFRPIWRPFHWSFMCDSKLRRICNMYVRLVLFIWSYVSLSIWFFFLSLKGQLLPLECYTVVILSPLFADSFQLSSYTYLCIISTSFWGCASAWLYLAIVPIWCLVSLHITLFLLKKSKEILW